MRILILMILLFTSCKKVVTTSTEQKTSTTIDICETEFQEFLDDNLKYFDLPDWAPHVVMIRDDQFVETLKTEYISCIIGKTENEIIQLFGKPHGNKDPRNPRMIYHCFPAENDDSGKGQTCLYFNFGEDDLVSSISYIFNCTGYQ